MSIKKIELSSDSARGLRAGLGMALACAALALSSSAFAVENLGMKVVRDAQTGELRAPTADELKTMQAQENALRTSAKSQPAGMLTKTTTPQVQRLKHGGSKLELLDDTMVYSVVHRNADGSLDMQCVTGSEAADKALTNPSANPQSKEQHNDLQ